MDISVNEFVVHQKHPNCMNKIPFQEPQHSGSRRLPKFGLVNFLNSIIKLFENISCRLNDYRRDNYLWQIGQMMRRERTRLSAFIFRLVPNIEVDRPEFSVSELSERCGVRPDEQPDDKALKRRVLSTSRGAADLLVFSVPNITSENFRIDSLLGFTR